MSSIFRTLYNSLPNFLQNLAMTDSSPTGYYHPTPNDVVGVKNFFIQKYVLPVELIDGILDHAEYWPRTTSRLNREVSVRSGGAKENQFLLRSYPLGFWPSEDSRDPGQILTHNRENFTSMDPRPWLPSREVPHDATEEVLKLWGAQSMPRGVHPCRKIVFTIKSHDQGWGGIHSQKGTYTGSYTWFDFGLERVLACKQSTLLEPREVHPFPQFRIIGDLYAPERVPAMSSPLTVCSLRTVIPVITDLRPDEKDAFDLSAVSYTRYKFSHSLEQTDMVLQKNKTATRDTTEHVIVWTAEDNISNPESKEGAALREVGRGGATGSGEFVRTMTMGDVITIWGKARFRGWMNEVEDIQIDVYWSV